MCLCIYVCVLIYLLYYPFTCLYGLFIYLHICLCIYVLFIYLCIMAVFIYLCIYLLIVVSMYLFMLFHFID